MSVLSNNILAGSSGQGGGAAVSYSIEKSLRFTEGDTSYLNRTFSSTSSSFTVSFWMKLGRVDGAGSYDHIFSCSGSDGSAYYFSVTMYNNTLYIYNGSHNNSTGRLLRDPSAWYHVVCSVSSNTGTLYVNNEQVQQVTGCKYGGTCHIGNWAGTGFHFDGYLADVHFVDGTALATTDFGEFDATTGVWNPKAYTGTYGTNGFHLPFSDNSTAAALGTDTSGNVNTWTVNNLSVAAGSGNDSLVDSPTSYGTDTGTGGEVRGNYATLNPLISTSSTLTNGNLDYASTATYQSAFSTIGVRTGKWYFEGTVGTFASDAVIGVGYAPFTTSTFVGGSSTSWGYEGAVGRIYNNGSFSAFGSTYGAGDVIGVAFDADTGKLWFAKNGTWQASGNPATGANPAVTLTTGIDYLFGVSAGNTGTWVCNWGARPFAYNAPSGFKALCTTNLPAPTIANPSEYMDVKLYTGTSNTGTVTVSGLAFSPDLVWVKNRTNTNRHGWADTIRGVNNSLASDRTDGELTSRTDLLTSFNSDGFTVGNDAGQYGWNYPSASFAAWCWDAGSSTVTNNDGTITSQVRANTSAGFSVIGWTGASSGTASIGHGLGVAPAMFIARPRNATSNWAVYHRSVGNDAFLRQNTSDASVSSSACFGTGPTSTVFTLNQGSLFAIAGDYIGYAFAPVNEYSSFGTYIGNGSSTNGPFVYTGFRPRWVLYKKTNSTGVWCLYDSARSSNNEANVLLQPHSSSAEVSYPTDPNVRLDILSNGFKLRNSSSSQNASGSTYLYAAFAESPFSLARAR